MIETERDSVTTLLFERLAGERSLRHLVTTRRTRATPGDFSPNLESSGDRRMIACLLGAPDAPLAHLRQVHGDRIVLVDRRPPAGAPDGIVADADGLVTGQKGIALAVKGADCPLVVLYDPEAPALCLVHSGWRSTVAHIVRNAVRALQMHFDSDPAKLLVGISPAIRQCCYEVGEEVAHRFEADFPPAVVQRRSSTPFLDLQGAIRADLEDCRVRPQNIETTDLCTSCRADLFYSYRRQGSLQGRNILAACLV